MTIPFDPSPSGVSMPQLASMTGIPSGVKPKKKTRRGGRGTGAKKFQSDPASHLTAAGQALSAGDTVTAKKHAFALVRALHVQHPPFSGTGGLSKPGSFPGGIQSTGVTSVPAAMTLGQGSAFPSAGTGGADPAQVRASRLVRALHSGKKSQGGY